AVGRWAAEHPGAEWIVGGSYDPAIAPRGEFDGRVLDAAVPDRPVVLRAYDYHTVWVNSEALRRAGIPADTPDPARGPVVRRAGITADTPDPDGGTIVRRADGTPMGTLREWGAVDLVLDLIPAEAAGDRIRALADAGRRYLRSGITWYQDAWVDPETVGVYLEAARRGTLLTRADLALRADPEEWRDQLSLFPELRERVGAEPAAAELLTA